MHHALSLRGCAGLYSEWKVLPMVSSPPVPPAIPLDAGFVHWGFVNLSVPNVIVIVVMVVVFVLALVVPFPGGRA